MVNKNAEKQPPPSQIIAEAADWLVRLQEKPFTADEQTQLEDWCARSPQHQHAWQAAQSLTGSLHGLPNQVAMSVLNRDQLKRRTVIKMLTGIIVIPAGGWLATQQLPVQSWTADLRTAAGEQKQLMLADGSQIMLNTRSAVEVLFSEQERRLQLISGEIRIRTAKDPAERPFLVTTEQGQVRALGTVFSIRVDHAVTHVSVQEDAVEIITADGAAQQTLKAGQQSRFSAQQIAPPQSLNANSVAWTRGQLIADNDKLANVISEIARYRSGWLRCDPVVADLRLSGVFQLTDTDDALWNIAHTLPVKLVYRSLYWVTVTSR